MIDKLLDHVDQLAEEIPKHEIPEIIGRLERLTLQLRGRFLNGSESDQEQYKLPGMGDPWLSIEEVMAKYKLDRRWLLDHTHGKPFRKDLSRKKHLFHGPRLKKWIDTRPS